jgi:hypothetical protein
MPQYIRNTNCDIDFLSSEGVYEYLEDSLTLLPPPVMNTEAAKLLFECLREKNVPEIIKNKTQNISWKHQPFELQSIAVGLKLYKPESQNIEQEN